MKEALKTGWAKVKNTETAARASKQLGTIKTGLQNTFRTVTEKIWRGAIETSAGSKLLDKADKKTAGLREKAVYHQSGYKAKLNHVDAQIKDDYLVPIDSHTVFNETEWRESTKYNEVRGGIVLGLKASLENGKGMEFAERMFLEIVNHADNLPAVIEGMKEAGGISNNGLVPLYRAVRLDRTDSLRESPRTPCAL